jgi:hypothetical protein
MALHLGTNCPKAAAMVEPTSFRFVIELWPSRDAMASEIGARPSAVSKWWQRDNIPAEWWASLLDTDAAVSAGVTADVLTRLAARDVAALESSETRT